MGVVNVTTRPHFYEVMEAIEGVLPPMEPESPLGKMQLRFSIKMAGRSVDNQRELAEVMSFALHEKPAYIRNHGEYACWNRGYYRLGGWDIIGTAAGADIASPFFTLNQVEGILAPITALQGNYIPDETIDIFFYPDGLDLQKVLNLCNIIEARNELITRALGLTEDLRIMVDQHVAFGMALDAFSVEKIEAVIYLLHQTSLQAMTVSKARMKPADGSNPKFQMRSWLLRLGFIGEQFERPRRTLLDGLDGNGAFFTDDGKKKAYDKRHRERAEALR